MEPTKDELQKKIEHARAELSEETKRAIDAVNWKSAILSIKEKKGYNLEQLQELETETELLLAGLINPENYPKELETRMKIQKAEAETLVNELNESIFKRIRDELIKNSENKNEKKVEAKKDTEIFGGAGIEIMPEKINIPRKEETMEKSSEMLSEVENPELINKKIDAQKIQSIASQKLSGSFQIPAVKTEYTLNNLSKQEIKKEIPTQADAGAVKLKVDPYREIPE